MKPVSMWVTLGMTLFLVLSTEAADVNNNLDSIRDVDFASETLVRPGIQPSVPVNPSFTFVETDPGKTNNIQKPNELVQTKLLKESRFRSSISDTTPTEQFPLQPAKSSAGASNKSILHDDLF